MLRQSSTVREDQLKGFIDGILSLVMKPEPKPGKKLDGLAEKMAKALMKQNNGKELTQDQMHDNNLINRLVFCIKASAAAAKTKDKTNAIDDLIDVILDDKKLPKPSPEKLKKIMGDEEKMNAFLEEAVGSKKANILTTALRDLSKKLSNEMKALKLTPETGKTKTVEDDMYTNLLGLTCSAVAGGHRVTLTNFIGNYVAIPDLNPNDGTDNLSTLNSTQDTQFGDPLSLNALAERRLDSLGDPTLEADINHLKKQHGINSLTPTNAPHGG